MKTIVDCNVIVSAGISDGNCRKVLKEIIINHDNFVSEPILLEWKRVISRKKFINFKPRLIAIMELICVNSSFEEIKNYRIKHSLPDKDDEIYLKTALKSQADYLITGNIKDFPKLKYGKTKIINPKDFLDLI